MLDYAKNIVSALAVVFGGLVFIPSIVALIFLKIADPVSYNSILMLVPVTINNGLVEFVVALLIVLPSVALIIWTIKDSRKFKEKGINTNPYLWGVGMVAPLNLIVLPLYFIRRNITWLNEKNKISSEVEKSIGSSKWLTAISFVTQNRITNNVGNSLKWILIVLIVLFGLLYLYRIPHIINKQKIDEQVAKIHSTKLTMDDVMGVNLPPDPGSEADKTVEGIDANKNGIRDDVEFAIFKEYPNSAKTRAVLLQYALVLQMELTQPFENERNVTEVVMEESRAHSCVADTLVPRKSPESGRTSLEVKRIDVYINFVEKMQFNTNDRKKSKNSFYEKLRSFSPINEEVCDIDLSMLPN